MCDYKVNVVDSADFADKIAALCYKHFMSIGKTGKPIVGKEWTLLSAIVKVDTSDSTEKMNVVSLTTGSKCIGRNSMSADGTIVNDSHAEVLARRCFLRYLYNEIKEIQCGRESDVLFKTGRFVLPTVPGEKVDDKIVESDKYALKPNVSFHMFSSHIPCGDSSIMPKDFINTLAINNCDYKSPCDSDMSCEHDSRRNKRKSDDAIESISKKIKIDSIETASDDLTRTSYSDCIGDIVVGGDIYRTGAKCLPTDPRQDNRGIGCDYHIVGAVRTKPGRGDPTLSVSCSDKIARWFAVGIQGALLSILIAKPIRLSSLIVGGGGPYSHESLYRAVIHRTGTSHRPRLLLSKHVFEMSKYSESNARADRPSPSAVMWTNVPFRPLEVAVQGRRQGTTKKSKDKGSLMVSKRELFKMFLNMTNRKYVSCTYESVKQLSTHYIKEWSLVKMHLGAWTKKPKSLNEFFVTDKELC